MLVMRERYSISLIIAASHLPRALRLSNPSPRASRCFQAVAAKNLTGALPVHCRYALPSATLDAAAAAARGRDNCSAPLRPPPRPATAGVEPREPIFAPAFAERLKNDDLQARIAAAEEEVRRAKERLDALSA